MVEPRRSLESGALANYPSNPAPWAPGTPRRPGEPPANTPPPDPESKAELHLKLCEKYLSDADALLAKGDHVQAGEKLWGAAAQIVKAVAAKRGLTLDTHAKLWEFVAKLRAELEDPEIGRLWASANALHRNLYEVHVSPELVKDYAQDVRRLVEKLKGLV